MSEVLPAASSGMRGPPKGRARRELIQSLVPPGRMVIDVGCDHGHNTRALGGIGTERRAHRLPRYRQGLRLVVADGLLPFREVDVAVITGIGALQIGTILAAGPRPRLAILHAPDRPAALRRWCAANGWRIDAEGLAPEGRRFAEVMRVVPGEEPHRGLELDFGPKLVSDPLVRQHAAQLTGWWRGVLDEVAPHSPAKAAEARSWIAFLSRFVDTPPPTGAPLG